MKKGILVLIVVIGSFTTHAQSLKDLLYSGKLKNDSNSVVKKTDDLSTKIDTTQKKAETLKPKTEVADASKKNVVTAEGVTVVATDSTSVAEGAVKATPAKTPAKAWKDYTDSLVKTMQADVLSSKKIKKETYYVTVDYEVDVDGQVSVTKVTLLPENPYLQDQLKQRLSLAPPQMTPVMDSTNKPRKVNRKYNFTITKE